MMRNSDKYQFNTQIIHKKLGFINKINLMLLPIDKIK